MERFDTVVDVCFLIMGIACTVFVIAMRKRFDPWVSIPVCTAWLLKCCRTIYYDWFSAAIRNLETDEAFLFVAKAQRITGIIDILAELLLCGVLLRLISSGLFWYRYKKEVQAFKK